MFAEEHELLKGSIFVLECNPPNNVHSAIRCIGHSPELKVENKTCLPICPLCFVFCSKQKFKHVPHFAFREPSTLVPLPTWSEKPPGECCSPHEASAIDSGHINH